MPITKLPGLSHKRGIISSTEKGQYQLRLGQYGAYFFNTHTNQSLTLEETLEVLNKKDPEKQLQCAECSKIFNEKQYEDAFYKCPYCDHGTVHY